MHPIASSRNFPEGVSDKTASQRDQVQEIVELVNGIKHFLLHKQIKLKKNTWKSPQKKIIHRLGERDVDLTWPTPRAATGSLSS
jgi:hypothetical protein